ncbi:MAG: FAD-dependent thymidylate synthase [Lachnospiraceae bacterium]|nr:FAD-dependent thymidylate synthase [Lachnospiraceae bacterium]
MNGRVTIINFNNKAHEVVSAAGRISTTEGSADEIYEKSCNNEDEKNIKLINKILSSGHESVLEHVYVNLSFDNVSVFVEQFMIEFRLASFTVKSRRYVDFGKMGYIMPDFSGSAVSNIEEIKNIYQNHMEYLFDEYNYFVEKGVPKEDARFVLPYSFKSNFYCTVNARELVKIMNEMVYGRGKEFLEIVELGQSLFAQCEDKLPYLKIVKEQNNIKDKIKSYFMSAALDKSDNVPSVDLVTLVNATETPEQIICKAAALNYGVGDCLGIEVQDGEKQREIIKELLNGGRKRELEQVNFTILFNKISLAGVTHLVRHRMQSILIPDYIEACEFDRYVLPESVVKAGLEERYREIFAKSKEVADMLEKLGMDRRNQIYLLLSGLTIPVMTTMNANELYIFFKLRTCNRAQWEIKECADELLRILREKNPILFSLYGPSCYVTGKCPEGKMTCGLMPDMVRKYNS